jgi:hypothetical protein
VKTFSVDIHFINMDKIQVNEMNEVNLNNLLNALTEKEAKYFQFTGEMDNMVFDLSQVFLIRYQEIKE